MLCGSFGYADVYTKDIVLAVIRGINVDGSVGGPRRRIGDKAVLTAQTATILSNILRFTLEEKYCNI